jgi:gluconate kinase
MQYALKLNVPLLFLLPNPSWTNTEVEEYLLYVDDGQVHEEHNLGEEEGAHLHHDEEHHDQEAGGLNDNERWAWMQTKVERISTEQQRKGVEISGLRNDVIRGNRMTEENNEMLRRMMQHLHLQGPPYGPQ